MTTMFDVVTRFTLLALFTCGILLLGGCSSTRLSEAPEAGMANRAAEEAAGLKQCQNELDALKHLNPAQHTTFRQTFDRLMSGAAQYSSLRSQINAQTQETVDALYRYKVNRLCAGIRQATLTGLARRGEIPE